MRYSAIVQVSTEQRSLGCSFTPAMGGAPDLLEVGGMHGIVANDPERR
jgi:hypothetical protein